MPRRSRRIRRAIYLALGAVALSACGSVSTPVAAGPSPTLSASDQELLAQLKTLGFQIYETPVTIGSYVFYGAGLNYDQNTFQISYSGLALEEWKAVDFNPESGKCSTADRTYSWNCSLLARSPHGHMLYAGPTGGLPGYPPDLGDIYVELGSTVVHIQGAGERKPSLGDLRMLADGLKPVTPDAAVRLNQKARDYKQYLQKTAANHVDFKTYLPRGSVLDCTLNQSVLQNWADPLHPYLTLHFGCTAKGNVAHEFWVDEFRDDVPLSSSHCGITNPEINGGGDRCVFWFTTSKGTAVYAGYSTTRFDLPSTRVVVWLSATIDKVTQLQIGDFVDSFVEVSPQEIGV